MAISIRSFRRPRTHASARVALCLLVTLSLCATPSASAAAPFTEEALARGLNYFMPQRPSLERFGYGMAFVDLDGDRDPDVVVTGAAGGRAGIFENDGAGVFTDRSMSNGIPFLLGRSGVVALDYDADGDMDLYFTQIDQPNVLARNDGNFQFVDVSAAAGVDDPGRGTGATVGDYDGDGWLDIHVPKYGVDGLGQPDRDALFHNLGDGTFAEVAGALGVADPSRGWQSVFFDMDWDGDVDLYVSNDKKVATELVMHNHLYENVGGTFNDISATSGTNVNIYSMGIAVGDFNANGWQDLYCTNLPIDPFNVLCTNQGGGVFTRDEVAAGVQSQRVGWGAVFFDYDNDGNEDLYVCNMMGANRLYVNSGTWPATDMGPTLGVADALDSFAVAVGDIENDGDLDLLVQNNDDNVRLYINHEGELRHWIEFDVIGRGSNLYAVGAHVAIRVGSVWSHRQIIAGGNNYKSQNELRVHFGLNAALAVDEVQVTWPGGAVSRTLTNIASDQAYPLFPPGRLGDGNGDGVIDALDVGIMVNVLLGADTGIEHTAVNDMNGDGTVNGADLAPFVNAMIGP
ncbi:MAG: FG-GAP-like repeat-containing protein [Phycisphaerae bacterium]